MNKVSYQVQGDTALIVINNPPVDALSFLVRKGIKTAVEEAITDKNVLSIILYGKNTFPSGLDINEFKDGTQKISSTLQELIKTIDTCSKPVIAAISRHALGGGFELAIACHYRVAKEGAIFGFPEVEIGLLPGATGTQSFPRLVDLRVALDVISTGRRINAKEALAVGAINKVVSGDVLKEAVHFAAAVAKQPVEGHRTSQLKVKDTEKALELRDAAIQKAQRKFRGQISPLFCIQAVMAAVDNKYDKGLQKESEYFNLLLSSGQAKALQYAFFAQRAASKWDVPGLGNYMTVKPQTVNFGAVIGAGTMGTGIAMAMLNAGMSVVLIEQDKKFLKRGIKLLNNLYEGSVRSNRMTSDEAKARLARMKPSVDYDNLKHVDIVVEAVYENLDVKRNVFRKLDAICKPEVLLCTNTSTLNIDKIAEVTSRPERVIGTHFFVPAYHMKLLENIRGSKSSARTIAQFKLLVSDLARGSVAYPRIKLKANQFLAVPVLVGNCDGFAANRMRFPQVKEAWFLLEEGCLPRDVDQVAEDFGLPLGPLKVSDLTGLDIAAAVARENAKRRGCSLDLDTKFLHGERVSTLVLHLCEQGRYGRKTGKGFYQYDKPNSKEPYDDPWISNFLEKYSMRHGVQRRKISSQEILERLLYSCINEGFKIMEEGICTRTEELDTLWLLGFAWPRYHGGPMFYANLVGLDKVYEKICYYYDKQPNSLHWQPARLLHQLKVNRVPFNDWNKYTASVSSQL